MTLKLSGFVLAAGPSGHVLLGPDDELPDWAAEVITNPKAWVDAPESTEPTEGDEPEAPEVATAEAAAPKPGASKRRH